MIRFASGRIPLPCTVPESAPSPDLDLAVAHLRSLDLGASSTPEQRAEVLEVVRGIATHLDPQGCDGHADEYARCVLHVDPSGWSLAAIVLRPGQTTPAHDHGGWGGAVTVQGVERDRRFRHDGDGGSTLLAERDYPPGTGYLFDQDDVHQPLGADPDGVTVALHFLARSEHGRAQHHHEGKAATTPTPDIRPNAPTDASYSPAQRATRTEGTSSMGTQSLPVAVIGGGPVGLAAAAHLLEKGEDPIVFEAGDRVGAGILAWGHVRLFSPWRYVVDAAAGALLEAAGWQTPDPESFPTGRELIDGYLTPLAQLPPLRSRVRLGHRVVSVARDGFDKLKSDGREDAPFLVTVQEADGSEASFLAKAVIDASGTIERPNPLGAAGTPAAGEPALRRRIFYGIPDVLGVARERYAGKRVLVVGSGHSAFNVLLDLVDLADQESGTSITWAIRRPANRLNGLFGGGVADALPARGELGERVRRLVESGRLSLVTGFKTARLTETVDGVVVGGQDEVLPPVDEIVAATGFRPDLSILSELRLDLDPALECPRALAPLIDPNVHSCGTVPPHGEEELRQPESGVYVVGMKSYGRAPTFLMLTGYEQVRSIACAIAGDWEGAREVRLVLPETGVCSSGILADRGVACCAAGAAVAEESGASCCAPSAATAPGGCCGTAVPEVVQLTAARQGRCCG